MKWLRLCRHHLDCVGWDAKLYCNSNLAQKPYRQQRFLTVGWNG